MPTAPRRLARAFLAVSLATFASSARAGIPDPAQSTVQNVIVGSWNGHSIPTAGSPCAPPHGESFLVVVRDAAGLPVGGAVVKLMFAGTGIALSALQNPGVTVSCPADDIGYVADATGVAKFTAHFGGYVSTPTIPVFANGILLANVTAASPDYDGDGRVSVTDLATFSADYLAAVQPARSDFDNCPSNRLSDLSYFAAQYLASQGTQLAPICP